MVSCLPARIWFSGKTSPCQGLVGSSILPIRTRRERKDPLLKGSFLIHASGGYAGCFRTLQGRIEKRSDVLTSRAEPRAGPASFVSDDEQRLVGESGDLKSLEQSD